MRHSNGSRGRPNRKAGQRPPGARDWRRWKRLTVIPALLVIVGGAVGGAIAQTPVETPEAPAHVGSASCSACHAEQVAAWRESHHGWALRVADDENIQAHGLDIFRETQRASVDRVQTQLRRNFSRLFFCDPVI